MYFAEKWSLYKRSSRPASGSDIVHSSSEQIISFCPVIFSLGRLTWPIFLPYGTPNSALLPNLISLGISVFIFIFPL